MVTPSPHDASSRPRVGVVGAGVVGGRIIHRLGVLVPDVDLRVVDTRVVDPARSPEIADLDVVVLAQPGPHHPTARRFLQRGVDVVSIADDVDDTRVLLDLESLAVGHDARLVVSAGMSSGLVALLTRHLSTNFASIDEVHVSLHGTAGPSCARQHHRALAGSAISVVDGVEVTSVSGTGRLLAWFPEPVGAYDCYRAELASPLIIRRAFPEVERIQARVSANRRDRLTSRLPMLTRPHLEGGIGAVRVEVRGTDHEGGRICEIAGIAELVGTAAAGTASAFVELLLDPTAPGVEPGLIVPGDDVLPTRRLLHSVQRLGVRLQAFTGVPNV